MARKRMISPEFWRDEKVGQLSHMERLLFIGLWTFADDKGVGRANDLLLKADIFPYDAPLRATQIKDSLAHLATLSMITLYENDGQKYYYIKNFAKHQSINKPTESGLPLPTKEQSSKTTAPLREDYGSATGGLPPNRKEEKRREVKGKEDIDCPEPEPSPNPPAIILPLSDNTDYPVMHDDVMKWAQLYPGVDIMQNLRNMLGWLDANPQRRKTRTGIKRFITNWLAREQDKGIRPQAKPRDTQPEAFQVNKMSNAELERLALEKLGVQL